MKYFNACLLNAKLPLSMRHGKLPSRKRLR
jgi:hypothetical protein